MSNDNKPDPHAENAKLYAEDMAETDRAWLRWEASGRQDFAATVRCTMHPEWRPGLFYRRIPQTIRIGEFDVPKPLTEVPKCDIYVPEFISKNYYRVLYHLPGNNSATIERAVRRGLAHKTRKAAKLHARALISLTEQEECNDE